MQTEEKYGQVVKERELFKEKERVYMETCDALNKLNDMMRKKVTTDEEPIIEEPVIDITGEEAAGGSTSKVFECDKCDFKASLKATINEHKKTKHADVTLPCDLCNFIAKTTEEYKKHVESKHGQSPIEGTKHKGKGKKSFAAKDKDNVKDNVNDKTKKKETTQGVKIPCDLCNFTSVSAEDFIKHIESKHQTQEENGTPAVYECNRCDFKAKSEEQFKKHLQDGHKLNTGGFKKVSYSKKSMKPCIYWNRGHCSVKSCKYEHVNIPSCTYNERCAKPECKFWHESYTRKFPFLEYRQYRPNVWPRREYQQSQNY